MMLVRSICTLALAALALSCAPDGRPDDGCDVRCIGDGPGLPPNRIECVNDSGEICAPLIGCRDSTPITIFLCTSDGPRCNDGSEPVCAPTEYPDGG